MCRWSYSAFSRPRTTHMLKLVASWLVTSSSFHSGWSSSLAWSLASSILVVRRRLYTGDIDVFVASVAATITATVAATAALIGSNHGSHAYDVCDCVDSNLHVAPTIACRLLNAPCATVRACPESDRDACSCTMCIQRVKQREIGVD